MSNESEPGRRPAGMLEDAVLAALWHGGRPMSPADVQAVLPDNPAYTTVMTTLARLHRKGLATRTRAGRGFVYSPNVDEAAHTATAMHDLLRRRRDRAAVLARFVSDLAPEDEVLLQRLLRQENAE
ncbi:BlaI/MecI/CopY family transcriptional regulator [Actinoallomurus purpureus]|uniref:BlaI/MecI/CopY family transcriptional regulator n=1 Tax=Actinoallomurus purpureus TaxID=478114 RepID=UPI0020936731|nr:BlaI/MecI/CopY family transcriptional regulator [Actinoallomurus purpureus]MCO6003847.1 BlaI/MecI/CopY family transcriptional regulator [Actinoallomurus purpureus]